MIFQTKSATKIDISTVGEKEIGKTVLTRKLSNFANVMCASAWT